MKTKIIFLFFTLFYYSIFDCHSMELEEKINNHKKTLPIHLKNDELSAFIPHS